MNTTSLRRRRGGPRRRRIRGPRRRSGRNRNRAHPLGVAAGQYNSRSPNARARRATQPARPAHRTTSCPRRWPSPRHPQQAQRACSWIERAIRWRGRRPASDQQLGRHRGCRARAAGRRRQFWLRLECDRHQRHAALLSRPPCPRGLQNQFIPAVSLHPLCAPRVPAPGTGPYVDQPNAPDDRASGLAGERHPRDGDEKKWRPWARPVHPHRRPGRRDRSHVRSCDAVPRHRATPILRPHFHGPLFPGQRAAQGGVVGPTAACWSSTVPALAHSAVGTSSPRGPRSRLGRRHHPRRGALELISEMELTAGFGPPQVCGSGERDVVVLRRRRLRAGRHGLRRLRRNVS